jgi:hypothetical protein
MDDRFVEPNNNPVDKTILMSTVRYYSDLILAIEIWLIREV